MFSQNIAAPLASSTVQLAQVLQGVRSAGAGQFAQAGTNANGTAVPGSILAPTPTFPQSFLQPQGFPQRVVNSSSLLSGISQVATNASSSMGTRTPGQMLDLYYTSLCQPAFPNITENPVSSKHNCKKFKKR